MNAQQFQQNWTKTGETLQALPLKKLLSLGVSPATAEFLAQAGLPETAAPLLDFCDGSDTVEYGVSKLTELYPFLPEEFEQYVVIGTCNEGDPIAINTASGQLEYLDAEADFAARPFNTSIAALAACLLAYRNFVLQVQEAHGEDAYIDAQYTEAELQGLKQALVQADPELMQRQGFWYEEFEAEQAMWEDSRKG
jgi:hypothetical protein